MHEFLARNRDELIARCAAKVARRPNRGATAQQLANGIPQFLEQLACTLQAEERGNPAEGRRISGPAGGDGAALSSIGRSAAAHGRALMDLGYTVDQVVHDYGDLCQAITELAVERAMPVSVQQFRTLNRCLDNAIADAVTEFSARRDVSVSRRQSADHNERLGVLCHELRNHLHTAWLAYEALESGRVPVGGSTGALVRRSLGALQTLLDRSLEDVRHAAGAGGTLPVERPFPLAQLIADARLVAELHASSAGCTLSMPAVDGTIAIAGNRDHLLAALVNLVQNAFKFSHPRSEVVVHAHADGDRVRIDVKDHCGGLPRNFAERMFRAFTQGGADRSGLGLGLSIAQKSIEADGGRLLVRDLPGTGCVFTIELPRRTLGDTSHPKDP